VALLVGVLVIVASLLRHDGDIAGLVKFGADDPANGLTAHAEQVMDRSVAHSDDLGHDGKFFFIQALDPLYLSPADHAVFLDRPVYRGQRMLFPLVAGFGGLTPAGFVPWTMALINLAAVAAGTLAASRLAQRYGGSPWLGLAFVANPGVLFEFDISGAGIVAFAAALWATLALEEDRDQAAMWWFTAAVLAREVMFLYLAGVLILRLWRTRRIPFMIGIVPTLAAGAWAAYLRVRLDVGSGVDQVQEFGWPFGGMVDAWDNWAANPVDLAVIAGLVIVMPMLIVRGIQQPNYSAAGAMGFVILALLMSRQVWWRFFDISRAVAPIITAYVLTSFSAPLRKPQDAVSL